MVEGMAAYGGLLHCETRLGLRDRVQRARPVNHMVHSGRLAPWLAWLTDQAALIGLPAIADDPR